jgi:hypothetical protein
MPLKIKRDREDCRQGIEEILANANPCREEIFVAWTSAYLDRDIKITIRTLRVSGPATEEVSLGHKWLIRSPRAYYGRKLVDIETACRAQRCSQRLR